MLTLSTYKIFNFSRIKHFSNGKTQVLESNKQCCFQGLYLLYYKYVITGWNHKWPLLIQFGIIKFEENLHEKELGKYTV